MKKKNLNKLSLRKVRISALKKTTINGGGFNNAVLPTETIQFTICYGAQQCQIFETREDCRATRRTVCF